MQLTDKSQIQNQKTASKEPEAYLHHGTGTAGPFRTESVRVKHEGDDRWLALFERRWRRVFHRGSSRYIKFQGDLIVIQIRNTP